MVDGATARRRLHYQNSVILQRLIGSLMIRKARRICKLEKEAWSISAAGVYQTEECNQCH